MNGFALILSILLTTNERPHIELPRAWLGEPEISECSVTESDIIRSFGTPDRFAMSHCWIRWNYDQWGIWFDWQTAGWIYTLGGNLDADFGPGVMRAIRAISPKRSSYVV